MTFTLRAFSILWALCSIVILAFACIVISDEYERFSRAWIHGASAVPSALGVWFAFRILTTGQCLEWRWPHPPVAWLYLLGVIVMLTIWLLASAGPDYERLFYLVIIGGGVLGLGIYSERKSSLMGRASALLIAFAMHAVVGYLAFGAGFQVIKNGALATDRTLILVVAGSVTFVNAYWFALYSKFSD